MRELFACGVIIQKGPGWFFSPALSARPEKREAGSSEDPETDEKRDAGSPEGPVTDSESTQAPLLKQTGSLPIDLAVLQTPAGFVSKKAQTSPFPTLAARSCSPPNAPPDLPWMSAWYRHWSQNPRRLGRGGIWTYLPLLGVQLGFYSPTAARIFTGRAATTTAFISCLNSPPLYSDILPVVWTCT